MTARTFVKRPVPIEAVRYDGHNTVEVRQFMYRHVQQVGHPSVWFHEAAEASLITPEGADAVVYDYLHRTWVGVTIGQWIMHGTEHEFYPCADDGTGTAPMNYEPQEPTP